MCFCEMWDIKTYYYRTLRMLFISKRLSGDHRCVRKTRYRTGILATWGTAAKNPVWTKQALHSTWSESHITRRSELETKNIFSVCTEWEAPLNWMSCHIWSWGPDEASATLRPSEISHMLKSIVTDTEKTQIWWCPHAIHRDRAC